MPRRPRRSIAGAALAATSLLGVAVPAAASPVPVDDVAHPGTPDVEHPPGTPVYDPSSALGTIYRTYRGYLGREPDADGFRHWADAHARGMDVVAIVERIVGSEELLARDMDPMVRAAPRFVDWAYVTVFDRPPDPVGLDWWLRLLGEGMPRAAVLAHIADSPEHRALTDAGTPPSYRRA